MSLNVSHSRTGASYPSCLAHIVFFLFSGRIRKLVLFTSLAHTCPPSLHSLPPFPLTSLQVFGKEKSVLGRWVSLHIGGGGFGGVARLLRLSFYSFWFCN
ncbi:hypothetical protein L873DRAFT_463909 [Choiromyces venosus 120613-1]|uniref:Uncharacterized protein n=1 Tax=Choiromyces venosus 120613-1 TaxID=1336337 RepID=A0A3N4K203_9PEZI|nr:hypothetical protein L873DRAFT_463909 [Choiromyces venosus 120613-1]